MKRASPNGIKGNSNNSSGAPSVPMKKAKPSPKSKSGPAPAQKSAGSGEDDDDSFFGASPDEEAAPPPAPGKQPTGAKGKAKARAAPKKAAKAPASSAGASKEQSERNTQPTLQEFKPKSPWELYSLPDKLANRLAAASTGELPGKLAAALDRRAGAFIDLKGSGLPGASDEYGKKHREAAKLAELQKAAGVGLKKLEEGDEVRREAETAAAELASAEAAAEPLLLQMYELARAELQEERDAADGGVPDVPAKWKKPAAARKKPGKKGVKKKSEKRDKGSSFLEEDWGDEDQESEDEDGGVGEESEEEEEEDQDMPATERRGDFAIFRQLPFNWVQADAERWAENLEEDVNGVRLRQYFYPCDIKNYPRGAELCHRSTWPLPDVDLLQR